MDTSEFCVVLSLFSYHEKAMVGLHFRLILTRLVVADFQVFRLLFYFIPVNLLMLFEAAKQR